MQIQKICSKLFCFDNLFFYFCDERLFFGRNFTEKGNELYDVNKGISNVDQCKAFFVGTATVALTSTIKSMYNSCKFSGNCQLV